MKKRYRCFLFLISCLSAFGLKAQHARTVIYLIGDAGELSLASNGIAESIAATADLSSKKVFIFLGDNIYPKGMPATNDDDYEKSTRIIGMQVELARKFSAEAYFVPGNHDWQRDGKHGWESIVRQQQWIDSLNDSHIHFFPKQGCPGPEEISLSENTTLIILDSQWFLHPWDKPEGEDSPCENKTPEDVAIELEDIMLRNASKRVIVAAHHPIYTYGEHGGYFTWKDHLFPLTSWDSSKLYIPMPVIGSLYPLYRKLIGSRQDVAHPLNKRYRKLVQNVLEKFPNTVYANGHEHALQYCWKDSIHYVTSGSSVKNTHVKKRKYSRFASNNLGYVRMDIDNDGSASVQYVEIKNAHAVYNITLPSLPFPDSVVASEQNLPTTVTTHASDRYEKSSRWLGENYRQEWKQTLAVPVIDLGKEHGGLKIIQRGGGMQTLSLRLEDSSKNEYTLRSIEKFPEKAVPPVLRKTVAADIVQDQISAAHPYAALVIPFLAEAAGIYHTNPKLVLIPDDGRLGIYRREFANTIALFEERPSGEAKDKPYFGNADKIISTDRVLEKLASDADNKVDQQFVLRSRLFDMVIGDWDRHDDQWRWAVIKQKKHETYRPIPRDRDQAFFCSDGWLAAFWSRRWILPKFEGFREDMNWAPGFMYNARYFDRSFLHELSAEQWRTTAKEIQTALTDDIIEHAIQQFPKEIFSLHGEEIIRKLKARRDALQQNAMSHYAFLAREVDVPGTNKEDWFSVKHRDDGNVTVSISKIKKSGEKSDVFYERTFSPKETKEIRLYGLDGKDVFDFSGHAQDAIKIRVVGGNALDSIANNADLPVYVYDVNDGIHSFRGKHLYNRTSTDPSVNAYDRKAFKYPKLAPLLYGNFNYDDGIFLGGGFLKIEQGFRKSPYKSQHLFLASFAPYTSSYNFKYDGRFMQVIGKSGIEVDIDWKVPNFVNNFFGWGNETIFDKHIDDVADNHLKRAINYYRVRLEQMDYRMKITYPLGSWGMVKAGPVFQRMEIETPNTSEARYIREYAAAQEKKVLDVAKFFSGVTTELVIDHRDHKVLTTNGAVFSYKADFMKGLRANANDFTRHDASVAFYHSFRLPARVTFAFRAGGGTTTGDFELYQAQVLDGKTELRGFRKTRFYGDSRLYGNSEVRVRLGSFRSYLFPAHFGINAFYDAGRVWYKDANGVDPSTVSGTSHQWHHGIGGGVWFTPFNLTVLSTEIAHGEDGNLMYVRLGFLF